MSIAFNGSSTKLTWAGNAAAAFPVTMFGWIKPTSATTSNMVFGLADFGGDDEIMAYADGAGSGKARAFARVDGGSTAADSVSSISANWQPVMVVFTNSASRTVYYGAGASGSDVTSAANVLSTHDRYVVGCRGKDDTLWFAGEIAEVAIWTSALGSTEWASLSGGALPEEVSNGTLFDSWSLVNSTTLTGANGHALTAANATNGGTHPISRGGGDATAPGATVTGTGTVAGGSASGGAAGTFTFDACENNAHSGALDGVAVNWTWLGGAVGSITSITNGSGTITTSGMTISGVPTGAGCGILRSADGTVVGYQEGTVIS